VIESLRANLAHGQNLELVHRLDRSTSGCLVIARRRSTLRLLHEQLRNRTTTKRYLLLVQGDWQLGQHEVDMPLDVDTRQGGQRTVSVTPDGRRAVTRFALREQYGDASLIEAIPVTGRTHQIRVHAAHCGHPIAGDERYGDRGFNAAMAKLGLRRLFLHASAIEFEYPEGHPRIFSAPLSPELRQVLDALEKRGRYLTPRARRRRTSKR
jgi:23S rRNA pseudouridine955/2504/2580 synthase